MMENTTVSISQRLTKLEEATQRLDIMNNTFPRPKIQRVPKFLRERKDFTERYTPKMISIGPIHHHLELGEAYKHLWTASYIRDTNQRADNLLQKIRVNTRELKGMYSEDTIKDFNDEDLAWMLFLDGCSVLEILRKADLEKPDQLHIKVDQLVMLHLDLFLLENQLPFQVLNLLSNEDELNPIKWMDKFLDACHHFTARKNSKKMKPAEELTRSGSSEHTVPIRGDMPIHLLDYMRTKFFVFDNQETNHQSSTTMEESEYWTTYRNIQELRDVGITAKRNDDAVQSEITFKCFNFYGTLNLSKLVVDEMTAPCLLNLIAHEMCPDFPNDFAVSSYVAFMDSLIDHSNDVKELRSAGVLYNALGSDEQVAQLFNIVSSHVVPDTTKYAEVRCAMERHYKMKPLRWLNQLLSTHFSTPWTIIGFIAAVAVVVLTAIQTWFAIPFNSKG